MKIVLHPVVITVKNVKSNRLALDSRKANDSCRNQSTYAERGRGTKPKFGRIHKKQNKEADDIKNQFELRIWANETIIRNKPTICVRNTRRIIQRIFKNPKKVLRKSRYSDHIPRKIDQTLEKSKPS